MFTYLTCFWVCTVSLVVRPPVPWETRQVYVYDVANEGFNVSFRWGGGTKAGLIRKVVWEEGGGMPVEGNAMGLLVSE